MTVSARILTMSLRNIFVKVVTHVVRPATAHHKPTTTVLPARLVTTSSQALGLQSVSQTVQPDTRPTQSPELVMVLLLLSSARSLTLVHRPIARTGLRLTPLHQNQSTIVATGSMVMTILRLMDSTWHHHSRSACSSTPQPQTV